MNRAILVKSCQKYSDRRQANRWADCLRFEHGIPVYFAIGGYKPGAVSILSDSRGGAIRLLCNDDYGNNSVKLREAIKRLGAYDHLFICDDDTFVHPQRWLDHEPAGEFECRLYHPQTDADKKRNSGRPWANGGAGWWMSRRLCELYVKEVTERCSWDDILASRIAQEHGVEIVDRPDLYGCDRYGDSDWRVSKDGGSLITCHPVEPAEMVEMWEAL
jgi:hypothetical protein